MFVTERFKQTELLGLRTGLIPLQPLENDCEGPFGKAGVLGKPVVSSFKTSGIIQPAVPLHSQNVIQPSGSTTHE